MLKSSGIVFTIAGLLLFASSCKKESAKGVTSSTTTVKVQTHILDLYTLINQIEAHALLNKVNEISGEAMGVYDSCFTATYEPGIWDIDTAGTATRVSAVGQTLTIEFNGDCNGADGEARSGGLTVEYTVADIGVADALASGTTNNLYVGGDLLDGDIKIKDFALLFNGNRLDEVESTISLTKSFGDEMAVYVKYLTTYENADLSAGPLDQPVSISGEGRGHNFDGSDFSLEVTTHLTGDVCESAFELTEGIIEVQPEEGDSQDVDFGAGDCDNAVTIDNGVANKTNTNYR